MKGITPNKKDSHSEADAFCGSGDAGGTHPPGTEILTPTSNKWHFKFYEHRNIFIEPKK